MLDKNVDIFLISEMISEMDDLFPMAQFKIQGFITPCRYGRNNKGGDLLFFIREEISSHLLQCM